MNPTKLLIVDDDEDDFLIVESLLDELGGSPFEMDWASSYEQGEAYFRQNRHAICLMDYKLGKHDGIELLKRSQELGFTGPVILLTGMHQGAVDMKALEAGAADYLVKDGLTAEQLERSIRYALARREMERERLERLRAESQNRSKSEFLAHLSHELRTPLSAILGFTELLMNKSRDDESLSHLNIVHRNGKHLLGLLNDILDLSKIEAGKLELEVHSVHFFPLLTDVYSLMMATAADKNLTLNISASTPLPQLINTDPTRLRQILLNLVGNAIKFTQEGSVDINVRMEQTEGEPRIWFTVKDTGMGISEEYIGAIFHPFVQARNKLALSRGGSGLGLTISKQLVERLGGSIHVESREHQGSVFSFCINPGNIAEVPVREFSLQYAASQTASSDLPVFSAKALVVDDLRDIRVLIGHYITRCGLEVSYASNGEEALACIEKEAARNAPFDLVFMDIHMPIMNGTEAAIEIRKRHHEFPLVALTAAHMKGDQERYLEAGFSACISKPVDQQRMTAALLQYLEPEPATVDMHDNFGSDRGPEHETEQNDRSVLVVEDSADTLEATSAILDMLGWSVIKATTGEQALAMARAYTPNKALLDLNLPDTDGYKLSHDLAAAAPGIEIIITSGEEVESNRLNDAVIATALKPLSIKSLRQALGP